MKSKPKTPRKGVLMKEYQQEIRLKGSPESQRGLQEMMDRHTGALTIIFLKDRQKAPAPPSQPLNPEGAAMRKEVEKTALVSGFPLMTQEEVDRLQASTPSIQFIHPKKAKKD